ncbi:hypothetical protein [Pseudonocardia asaccharolytica]|uniref:hypothetical protein n=1 Tax=Pseudonocardia asaccharolytica TaxID=54010 RepID=UPI000490283D|nr:hypothetical protein [Pseudonocardia asaccharolytica]
MTPLTVDLNSVIGLISRKRQVARPPRYTTWRWTAAKESIATLATLEPITLGPGHGRPLTTGTASALRDFASRLGNGRGRSQGRAAEARYYFGVAPDPSLDELRDIALAWPVEVRGAEAADTRIHSVRLPSFVVTTEVVFGGPDERLTMRRDPRLSPGPYVPARCSRYVGGRGGRRAPGDWTHRRSTNPPRSIAGDVEPPGASSKQVRTVAVWNGIRTLGEQRLPVGVHTSSDSRAADFGH